MFCHKGEFSGGSKAVSGESASDAMMIPHNGIDWSQATKEELPENIPPRNALTIPSPNSLSAKEKAVR
jgi:hypothetical protein